MGCGTEPRRIVYVIAALVTGGAEKQLYHLIRGLDNSEFAPHLIAFAGGEWEELFHSLAIPIALLPYSSGKFAVINRLRHQLLALKPDIVHTFGHSANYVGRIAAIMARVPHLIATERSSPAIKTRSHLALDRVLSQFTEHTITNSHHAAEFCVGRKLCHANKITVVPNGIDTSLFTPARATARASRIGYVADFRSEKHHSHLIEAMSFVRAAMPQAACHLAGEGPLRSQIENRVRDLNMEQNVILRGWVDNMPQFLNELDVYVHPSLYEGCPNAVMEAMACALPCVVMNTPGCTELVQDGRTGIVVKSQQPEDFANAILEPLRDRNRAEQLGMAGHRFVEHNFSIAKMVEGTMQCYKQALERKRVIRN